MSPLLPAPNLYRVAVTALVVALAGNILLWRLSRVDDWFAEVIAVASGITAVALVATAAIRRLVRWREEALLLAAGIWVANLIEFATEDAASWESRVRQGSFYAALAILAVGTFVGERARTGRV